MDLEAYRRKMTSPHIITIPGDLSYGGEHLLGLGQSGRLKSGLAQSVHIQSLEPVTTVSPMAKGILQM